MQAFGKTELLSTTKKKVAVIGPRAASGHILEAAGITARHLTRLGYVVVSGCANGVDTAAMLAALHLGGDVIGYDYMLPNRQDPSRGQVYTYLKSKLLSGGCIVYATPGVSGKLAPLTRNKVMVESVDYVIAMSSMGRGTMHAVREAKKRNLPVFLYQEVHKLCQTFRSLGELQALLDEAPIQKSEVVEVSLDLPVSLV